MGMLFMGGAPAPHDSEALLRASQAESKAQSGLARMRDLEHEVQRLCLLNQALWELIRDRLNLKDADLERIAERIDLRDGVADGRVTDTPVKCPTCGRISNSKHYKCLYCGQLFEKPMFG